MMVWQTMETAPRDGTRILAWNADYGQRETSMQKYGKGSPGFAEWEKGDGPLNAGWGWQEPQHNWGSTWKPTHWMPLPASPLPDNAVAQRAAKPSDGATCSVATNDYGENK